MAAQPPVTTQEVRVIKPSLIIANVLANVGFAALLMWGISITHRQVGPPSRLAASQLTAHLRACPPSRACSMTVKT